MKRPSYAVSRKVIGAANQRVEGLVMGRALLVIAIVAGVTLDHAAAQFGGMPGLPGNPSDAPPAQCRELLTLREHLEKHGAAITVANERKVHASMACRLFREYVAAEAKMIWALDIHGSACGVPAQINHQFRASHAKSQQIGKKVCDAAGRPFRHEAPPIKDDRLRPLNPIPRREPWPTRVSERR
jgi:hypothetical protein